MSVIKKIVAAFAVAAAMGLAGSVIYPVRMVAPEADGPLLGEAKIDPQTLGILERSCQNCHSERTKWPWYSHIAPISWMIASDVGQARSHMNLSHWQEYSREDRMMLLSAIGSAVRNRKMPVGRYVLLHPEARLTDQERQQIYQWTRDGSMVMHPRQQSPPDP
jgi:hypothetical protein